MKLNKKIAIITGGASGFGAGIVKKFTKEGAMVVIADVNLDLAHELASEIGNQAMAVKVDVAVGDSVKSMVEAVTKKHRTIDIEIGRAHVRTPVTSLSRMPSSA